MNSRRRVVLVYIYLIQKDIEFQIQINQANLIAKEKSCKKTAKTYYGYKFQCFSKTGIDIQLNAGFCLTFLYGLIELVELYKSSCIETALDPFTMLSYRNLCKNSEKIRISVRKKLWALFCTENIKNT